MARVSRLPPLTRAQIAAYLRMAAKAKGNTYAWFRIGGF